ncbi:hypothetical protein [Bifidobacterium leontopitheci]|uniref:Uncharacterized protein n=1 Tax=Bifidobacterium leontopitheci TaxID=2650774 RepID=A0A6I1GJR0_9BIFI|nr:hypothetical protein [Bifidobacterium leontopitheci]KAB7789866.1 hypothetical protein F7D09_1658 [Bifidobacterium leontopitheci]
MTNHNQTPNGRTVGRASSRAVGRLAAKATALLAAATLTLTGFALTGTARPALAATPDASAQEDTPFDYYSGIANLPETHVFENITLERLEDILRNGTGKYAILIGGTWDANVTRALPVIDKAAKAQGIKKVYNFDPHLDNAGADTLVDVNDKTNTVKEFAARFQKTVDDFGLGAIQSKDASKVVDLPTLFTYDKDAAGGKVLAVSAGADATADEANVTKTLSTAKNAAVRTNGDFYVKYYTDAKQDGQAAVFKDGEQDDISLVSVTYGELEKLLQSPGGHYVFFGATWCGNTYATIRYVNQEARKYGVKHVYTFDTILDNTSGKHSPFHIRDSYNNGEHPLADLYTHLVNTYLPNLVTEDGSHGIVDSKGVGATRLQVPLLLHYDKDNTTQLAGTDQPAGPVTDEVVDYQGAKYNVGTTPTPTAREYMLTWAGTTYDDATIVKPYILQGDDLKPAKNFGRTVTNDRDAYIAQTDHFFSLTELRGQVASAEAKLAGDTSSLGYTQQQIDAYKAQVAAAKAKLVKNAPLDGKDGTDAAVVALAKANSQFTAGTYGKDGGQSGDDQPVNGQPGGQPGASQPDGDAANDGKPAGKRIVTTAGGEQLSRTGADVATLTTAALLLGVAAAALTLARRRLAGSLAARR